MKKRNPTTIRVCTAVLLFLVASLFSCSAMYGRPDTMHDVQVGKTTDWIVIGPMWAGFIFLCVSSLFKRSTFGRTIAAILAAAVWLTVGIVFNRWEDEKLRARTESWQETQGLETPRWDREQSRGPYR